jgi:hypothetical protein
VLSIVHVITFFPLFPCFTDHCRTYARAHIRRKNGRSISPSPTSSERSFGEQTLQILGSFALKYCSEGNRESGENRSAVKFLWVYGVLSLSSTMFTCLGAILILVLCSLRSSKHLHNSVRWLTVFCTLSCLTYLAQMLKLVIRTPTKTDSLWVVS